MSYDTVEKTDAESVMPSKWGGMWFLKDEINTEHLGFTILELKPGGKGKEHDETSTQQEEIYYVVTGTVDVLLTDETVTLSKDEAIRLDPQECRQIHNRGDELVKLVLVGAPL
ncbi:cupin [halophilic archaeon]|nr:cupin [halophilic archaeon]